MHILLDTHIILWAAYEPTRLSTKAKAIIEDQANTLLFSVASLWEIAIKNGLGRSDFNIDLPLLRQEMLANDYHEVEVNALTVLGLATLPNHHKDPFDRLLIAQAQSNGVTLLTADTLVSQYKARGRKILLI